MRRTPPAAVAVREYLDAFIVAGLAALFLITFVIRTFYIPSDSMLPTLHERDVLLVNEFAYRFHAPRRGDIVVFTPPVQAGSPFIKRVIGVPGDRLRIDGGVYVNGRRLREPYISQEPAYKLVLKNYTLYVDNGLGYEQLWPQEANIPPRKLWQAPDRIPNGYYFVMGDNRNDSDDSHVWGFAQLHGQFSAGPLAANTHIQAQFTGRAFFLLWPFDRLRILN